MPVSRAKLVVCRDPEGRFYWMLLVRGKEVAVSTQHYSSKSHARRAAEALARNTADASVVDE